MSPFTEGDLVWKRAEWSFYNILQKSGKHLNNYITRFKTLAGVHQYVRNNGDFQNFWKLSLVIGGRASLAECFDWTHVGYSAVPVAVTVTVPEAAWGSSTWSWGTDGGGRPPPSSGFRSATPAVPMRTQLKLKASTGLFSVWASMLMHMCTFRPTKYTSLNLRQTRLRVQAGGNIGTHIGLGFRPVTDEQTN